jgi:hypothetical protein
MKKQTAVEYLVEQLKERGYAGEFPPHLLFDQAIAMEKEQIIHAYKKGNFNARINYGYGNNVTSEQYYTETYRKDDLLP